MTKQEKIFKYNHSSKLYKIKIKLKFRKLKKMIKNIHIKTKKKMKIQNKLLRNRILNKIFLVQAIKIKNKTP